MRLHLTGSVGTWAGATGLALALAAAVPGGAALAGPTPPPVTLHSVPAVLAPVDPAAGTGPTTSGLTAALGGALTATGLGRNVGMSVLDVATGTSLFGLDPGRGITPASTTKVLTAAAVLAAAGPDTVLHTTVLRMPESNPSGTPTIPAAPTPGAGGPAVLDAVARLVLVGGGDPLLSSLPTGDDAVADYPRRASLDDLATQVVRDLGAAGINQVRLRFDTGLFPGPAASPRWERSYTGDVVGPVMALSADQGRPGPLAGGRLDDPALHTAVLFAAELKKRGIKVLGAPTPGTGPAGSETIADVASAPISALVEHMLVESDNDVAEAMARQVAIARGKPGTFDDGAAAVLAELTALGIDVTGVTLHDGSGLSREDRIPPRVIASVLALAAAGPHPELRPLVAGLAIAGGTGTLAARFGTAPAINARGILRAKTGYLTGVVTLSGLLIDAGGRLLAFDVATDNVKPGSGLSARAVLDRIAGLLARCGCT